MSDEQHEKDLKDLKDKHLKVGEACLNRHVGYYADSNTCSYRGQGRKKALSNNSLYDWPQYESLSRRRKGIETEARKEGKKTVPEWYTTTLKVPKRGDWDVATEGNFKYQCYTPYWHEAHHVIPNSTLRAAIAAVGQGMKSPSKMVLAVRGGLLDEGYNLNNKINMIILPMDREVSMALGLPKHRKTQDKRSHEGYSKHVRSMLDEILGKIREDAAKPKHPKPNYQDIKKQLEALSEDLYKAIIEAGKAMKQAAKSEDSLDDMSEDQVKAKPKPKTSKAGPRP